MWSTIFLGLGIFTGLTISRLYNWWLVYKYNKSIDRDVAKLMECSLKQGASGYEAFARFETDPEVSMRIAKAFAAMLAVPDAPNFLETKFDSLQMRQEGCAVIVTVQRIGGKSPGQIIADLKRENAALKAEGREE